MTLTKDSTGADIYEAWQESGLRKKRFWRECLESVGMTYNAYHSKVRNHALRTENETLRSRIIQLETEHEGMYWPSARDDTDWDQWAARVAEWQKRDTMIKGQTHYDMHMPDNCKRAEGLRLQINRIAQPDFAVLGSDSFDFDVLSLKYKRMYNRKQRDPFEEVRAMYDDYVTRLIADNPKVVLIAIGDNHGQQRTENFINELIPIFGDRITAAYNELIRSRGRVLWLGWVQEFRLGTSLFEHGKKTAANAAAANIKNRGSDVADIAGHVHRITQQINMNEGVLDDGITPWHYPVMSVTTGHGQNTPPHYITDTHATNSQSGCAVVDINLRGKDVHIQNLLFHPRRDGSLVTMFGEHMLAEQDSAVAQIRGAA
jgi:hypothetical protein